MESPAYFLVELTRGVAMRRTVIVRSKSGLDKS